MSLSGIQNTIYNYDPLKQVRVYLIFRQVLQNDSLLENSVDCAWVSESIRPAVLKRRSTGAEDGSSVICRQPQYGCMCSLIVMVSPCLWVYQSVLQDCKRGVRKE